MEAERDLEARVAQLEMRVSELEGAFESAMEWIAVLGKQDATLLMSAPLLLSTAFEGKVSPPPGGAMEDYQRGAARIVSNAIAMNNYLDGRRQGEEHEGEGSE